MRLINVNTRQMQEFFGTSIPNYAILSHRWEIAEVTFKDFQSGRGEKMAGWKKIIGLCNEALKDGLEYVWMDSCCIDKSSSAELSEAINTMFRWYQDADICYAFLSDVSGPLSDSTNADRFRFSKWFTRGWTLQELIAPENLVFFDKNWVELGTKESLTQMVTSITGIQHLFNFQEASIAQRMSWASKRETTRIEDQAYCLMGLFGVNMPPLYGEGQKAFLRLQLEIMKFSNDETLFAWEDEHVPSGGLLAPTIASFKHSGNFKSLSPQCLPRAPYLMTNKGLQIEFNLFEADKFDHMQGWYQKRPGADTLVPLNCVRDDDENRLVALLLRNLDGVWEEFERASCEFLLWYPRPGVEDQEENGSPLRSNTPDIEDEASNSSASLGSRPRTKLIYIKQPDMFSGMHSQCLFQIHTRFILASGFQVEKKFLSNSERGIWIRDPEVGLGLRLSNSTALIQFGDKSDVFMLKLVASETRAAIDVLLYRCEVSRIEAARVFRMKDELLDNFPKQFGAEWCRTSKCLHSGKTLQIGSQEVKANGRRAFVVEIKVSPKPT